MEVANSKNPGAATPRGEQDDFVYRVSHDLRSPISTIMGFSELLLTDHAAQLSPDALRYLQSVKQAANRMNGMIEGLLAYSRIGRAPDAPRMCDMKAVLEFSKMYAMRRTRRHDAVYRIPDTMPQILGVESELQTLFGHLLANAVQYNPNPAPEVDVTVTEEADKFVMAVRDNGPGIEPRFHQDIFKIFVRLVPQGSDASTGMGLALCKRIAELHRGRIWIESAKDQGATFFVALPKRKA